MKISEVRMSYARFIQAALVTSYALTLLFSSGCALLGDNKESPSNLRPTSETLKSPKIEPEARGMFSQAERAFAAKNYDQAIRLYQSLKTKYPKGRAAMLASYRLGTIYYYREEYANASKEFDSFLARYPQSDLTFDVLYNQAAAEFQLGHYEKAYSSLSRLKNSEIQSQGPRRAEVVYSLTAQAASALGNHPAAVAAYAAEMQLPLDETARTNLAENVDSHLAKIDSREMLERLASEVTEPVTRTKITDRLKSLGAGGGEMVAKEPITPNEPKPETLSGGSSSERLNIGVVLPLTGKFAAYGKRALDGILLAARSFRAEREANFRIFVEDSASSPIMAQQAVETLVSDHNVSAILGPINWKESLAVAEKAQQLGVLNISLTAKEGISEKGPYLFQNALTPRIQIDNLVGFCVREKKYQRFAILAPNDNFGKDLANEFWEAVERYGGHVVAYQSYASGEKDFQAMIKELVGISDQKLRRLEWAKIWEFANEKKAKEVGNKPRGANKEPKIELPPIIDFDAIFIPDTPKAVAQMAASLAYFDVSGIPLLGTSEWNSDQLYKRGGKYVEGALFPGGISSSTRNNKQREFIRLYAEAYGSAPDLLATQSFEAMDLVTGALKRTTSSDRNELVNQLAAFRDFDSPLGSLSFDATRLARRKIPIYMLDNGGAIVEQ